MIGIYLLLLVVAAVGVIGIPIRLIQILRGTIRRAYLRLSVVARIAVAIGLTVLLICAIPWVGVIYIAVMVFTDDTTPRIWGGSELGMISSVLGSLYLMAELLLALLTVRQIRKERAISA